MYHQPGDPAPGVLSGHVRHQSVGARGSGALATLSEADPESAASSLVTGSVSAPIGGPEVWTDRGRVNKGVIILLFRVLVKYLRKTLTTEKMVL